MIKVTGIEANFEPATEEFEYFEIKYEDFDKEGLRIGVAAVYLKRIDKKQDRTLKELRTFSKESGGEQEKMLEKTEVMIEKQDKTISIIKSGVDETCEFREENRTIPHDFHQDTILRFDNLDIKYSKIAESIEKLILSMDRTSKNVERILEEMKEERRESRMAMDEIPNAILKLAEKTR